MTDEPFVDYDLEQAIDQGQHVAPHRHRQIRDGVTAIPAQDLKDDPEVIRMLNRLDNTTSH